MKEPKIIDGAISIKERPNDNITITELGGESILIYKETAIELAKYILSVYGE